MRAFRAASSLFAFIAYVYAFWQGPFHGKWAEGAFWMAVSISAEFGATNLGKD